jgi:hypothetical protein
MTMDIMEEDDLSASMASEYQRQEAVMFLRTPDEIIELLQYEGCDDDDDESSEERGALDRFWHQGIEAWTWDDRVRVAAAARSRRSEITIEVDLM